MVSCRYLKCNGIPTMPVIFPRAGASLSSNFPARGIWRRYGYGGRYGKGYGGGLAAAVTVAVVLVMRRSIPSTTSRNCHYYYYYDESTILPGWNSTMTGDEKLTSAYYLHIRTQTPWRLCDKDEAKSFDSIAPDRTRVARVTHGARTGLVRKIKRKTY